MSAPLKIAVLEDNDDLRELTVAALQRRGHQAMGAYDAEELDELLASRAIDLLLLDLNLPGEGGLSVARRLKAATPDLFIIMTTALGRLDDRVAGYDHGADVYLCKPVSEDELLAAVASIGRRVAQRSGSIEAGLRLNEATLELTGVHTVVLTRTEAALLKTLAQAQDRRVETFRLLERTNRDVDAKAKASLEVQMVNLRKKIAAAGYPQPSVRAIRGEGYELLCPLRLVSESD